MSHPDHKCQCGRATCPDRKRKYGPSGGGIRTCEVCGQEYEMFQDQVTHEFCPGGNYTTSEHYMPGRATPLKFDTPDLPAAKLYYIQDCRQVVGNCAMWWGPNRSGYTCNLNDAGVYTEEDALAQQAARCTDVARPKDLIDAAAVRHFRADIDWEQNGMSRMIRNQADMFIPHAAEYLKTKGTWRCRRCRKTWVLGTPMPQGCKEQP